MKQITTCSSRETALSSLINAGGQLNESIAARAQSLADQKAELRDLMIRKELIRAAPEVPDATPMRAVGVDGAYLTVEKQYGDLVMVTALECPVCMGHGDEFKERCDFWLDTLPRSIETEDALRGLMALMEIRLARASEAPLVFIDGSFASLLINIGKGFMAARAMAGESPTAESFLDLYEQGAKNLKETLDYIFNEPRFVAFPKYNTLDHFADLDLPQGFRNSDSRTVATFALEAGEMTKHTFTMKKSQVSTDVLLNIGGQDYHTLEDGLRGTITVYYKPHPWSGAFRIDFTDKADEEFRLQVLQVVFENTKQPEILEPLPLYMADVSAKEICQTFAAVGEASVPLIEDDMTQMFLSRNYRT